MRPHKRSYFILFIITVICATYFSNQNKIDLYKRYLTKTYNKIRNIGDEQMKWEKDCKLITIKSSVDSSFQKAYFYKTISTTPKPLLVSLHTWSGDYTEYDGLSELSMKNDFNYIHPNFRGANSKSDACLSKKVISDIDDAIDFAKRNANVDESKIYIIGASGGGYTGLGAFIKSKHKIARISIWVPITDLISWYNYGVSKNKDFILDILACTSSSKSELNILEAKKRSPIYWNIPTQKLRNCQISLYTGIYDGIDGNVPISHSIDFYNKTLNILKAKDSLNYVTVKERFELRNLRKSLDGFEIISNRKVHLKKNFENISLTIFEGGHEMLIDSAFLDFL